MALIRVARNGNRPTHGATRNRQMTAEFSVWRNMHSRCYNPKFPYYRRYGGRGIVVCDRWHSYANFIADMGARPSADFQIERNDNDGPYCKDNCRWATRKEQGRNKTGNRLVTFRGETMPLIMWAERFRISPVTLGTRLDRGWDIERAMTMPVMKKRDSAGRFSRRY